MTPLRIALMLGGCWVIPMFISFLPIMQGWNNIGIIDLVSRSHWLLSSSLYLLGILNKQTGSGLGRYSKKDSDHGLRDGSNKNNNNKKAS